MGGGGGGREGGLEGNAGAEGAGGAAKGAARVRTTRLPLRSVFSMDSFFMPAADDDAGAARAPSGSEMATAPAAAAARELVQQESKRVSILRFCVESSFFLAARRGRIFSRGQVRRRLLDPAAPGKRARLHAHGAVLCR